MTAAEKVLQLCEEKSPLNGFEPVEGINIYRELGEPEKRLFWRLIIKEIRFRKDRQTDVIFL